MKLHIDTSNSEKIIVGLDDEKFEASSRKLKSQRLLPFIYEIISKKKKEITDLTAIDVNTGPGSFTGLRIGVAVASAVGWALGIKVNDKDIRKGETVDITYNSFEKTPSVSSGMNRTLTMCKQCQALLLSKTQALLICHPPCLRRQALEETPLVRAGRMSSR